jgi:hypothetical protein
MGYEGKPVFRRWLRAARKLVDRPVVDGSVVRRSAARRAWRQRCRRDDTSADAVETAGAWRVPAKLVSVTSVSSATLVSVTLVVAVVAVLAGWMIQGLQHDRGRARMMDRSSADGTGGSGGSVALDRSSLPGQQETAANPDSAIAIDGATTGTATTATTGTGTVGTAGATVPAEKRVDARRAARAEADTATATVRTPETGQTARSATRPSLAPAREDPRAFARAMLAQRGWSGQWGCLNALWQRESSWDYRATNPSSGAYGIPQSLPPGKMADVGVDWRTNPQTQIRWGLAYISWRYGTPCKAWAHSQATGWY